MLKDEQSYYIISGHLHQLNEMSGVTKEPALLQHYISQHPTYSTVYRWIHSICFTHDLAKKSHFVDGHTHTHKREQQEHCTKNTKKRTSLGVILGCSFPWKNWYLWWLGSNKNILNKKLCHQNAGIDIIEFNFDDHEELQKAPGRKHTEFVGNISVREAPDRNQSLSLVNIKYNWTKIHKILFNGWIVVKRDHSYLKTMACEEWFLNSSLG